MKNLLLAALGAAIAGAVVGTAHAAAAETRGGLAVRSDDGNFEATLGARIHLDAYVPVDDAEARFEGGAYVPDTQVTDLFFRRARLTLEGKAYGWSYKFENDFADQNEQSGSGFAEMWLGTELGKTKLRFGQAKPHRSMDSLTDDNDLLFIERPFSSSDALYGNRKFLIGAFLDGGGERWGWGLSGFNLRSAKDTKTDGCGAAGRVHFAPVLSEHAVLHLGAGASVDNPANGLAVEVAKVKFFGKGGESQSLGATTTDRQLSYAVELAGGAGPARFQSEYARATFAMPAGKDLEVNSYYVQAAWLLTGETVPYHVKKGAFKRPKPKRPFGAWEAKLRYDFIGNDGVAVEREITQLAAGLNGYANDNVKLALEYIRGDNQPETGAAERGTVIAARLQLAL